MINRVADAIAPAFEPEPAVTALVVGVARVMTESPERSSSHLGRIHLPGR